MFSAVKALNPKIYKKPQVEDIKGKIITNPNEILQTVANHFKSKLKDESNILLFKEHPERFETLFQNTKKEKVSTNLKTTKPLEKTKFNWNF